MKRSIGVWQLWGFAVTSLLGTLLHYLYDLLGEKAWIAPFSGVNESTWEHMKLLFWPLLLFGVVERFFFREREDFWCVKLRGTLLGLISIPAIFYTYNGVIGKSPDWLNVAIFFVSAALVFFAEWRMFKRGCVACKHPRLSLFFLVIIALAFAVFTFLTPKLGIFLDPVTGAYGI